jgi:hypothetical protein
MHILIPSTQCLLCSSSVTSLLAMVTMSKEELAAAASAPEVQPPLPLEPPPHLRDSGLDYCSLMLVDLAVDTPKSAIRAIFESMQVDFGGQGPS